MIRLHTTKGVIDIELDHAKAPETAANFLQYAKDGFYEGTLFHRVIPNFMIQGGGLLPNMTPKATRPPIKNEASSGLKNTVGSVAMARTSAPHSATSQFFINVNNNDFLDYPSRDGWGYCVFGKVAAGMDVVNAIVAVPTTSKKGHENVPVDDVLIQKVEVIGE
ncbi:MAG: peptidylprolyl isomerase [Candidatus Competibacteraceae bacterium]